VAACAGHARNVQGDVDGLTADGHGPEGALLVPAWRHPTRAAQGAATGAGPLSDGKADVAALVGGAQVVVAVQAEGMVQQAGGHAGRPSGFGFRNPERDQHVRISSTPMYASTG